MITVGSCKTRAGFTIAELLVVFWVLLILAAIIIPAPGHPDRRWARIVHCMSNLKQVSDGLQSWSDAHERHFPFELSVSNGGSQELITKAAAAAQFQPLTNYLTNLAQVLICPAETKRRVASTNQTLSDSNISYFINIDASPTTQMHAANLILAGDRHLTAGTRPVAPGMFVLSTKTPLGWTTELHGSLKKPSGIFLFLDGHVEEVRADRLTNTVQNQPLAINRLLIP